MTRTDRGRVGEDLHLTVGEVEAVSFSRGDIEVALLIANPEVEMRNIGWKALGLSARYHGHDGWRAFVRDWAGARTLKSAADDPLERPAPRATSAAAP